jgi:hypothetical protein
MDIYFVFSNNNNKFIIIKILLLLKISKVCIHIIQITNYNLNGILSNFMVNKKAKHKNAAKGKNDICPPTLTLGWSISKKNQPNGQ